MAYSRVTWEDGATALSAEHMNNIEEGISEALTNAQGNSDMWSYIRNLVYPVGSIYMSATLSTVAAVQTALGGTWVAWGKGRVPVGVDTSKSAFDTVEETGGTADAIVPTHTHTATFSGTAVAGHTHALNGTNAAAESAGAHTHSVSGSALAVGDHVHGINLTTEAAGTHKHTSKTRTGTAASGTGQRSGPWSQDTIYSDQVNVYTSEAGSHSHSVSGNTGANGGHNHTITGTAASAGAHTHSLTGSSGSAGAHTPAGSVTVASTGSAVTNANLQPYITCYMYKRVG